MAGFVALPARFEQEPSSPLGLVDPVLDQTRGRDVAMFIDHVVHLVANPDRIGAMVNLLLSTPAGAQTLVFARTRADVAAITRALTEAGFQARALSGETPSRHDGCTSNYHPSADDDFGSASPLKEPMGGGEHQPSLTRRTPSDGTSPSDC